MHLLEDLVSPIGSIGCWTLVDLKIQFGRFVLKYIYFLIFISVLNFFSVRPNVKCGPI